MGAEGSQRKMPMRRQSLRGGRALPILLAGSLLLCTHLLCAQESALPVEIRHQLAPIPEATSHLGTAPETLPEAPRSQTESCERLFRIRYHYALINIQAAFNLQQPTGTAELLGETRYFSGSASSQWLTMAYGKVHHPTIQPTDPLKYYGHHIPWAVPTVLRVSQQVKAHPRLTGVLKLLTPLF